MIDAPRSRPQRSFGERASFPPRPRRGPWLLALVLISLWTQTHVAAARANPSETPTNQAGLLIVHGRGEEDATLVTRCVAFEPEEISGYELLQLSGLDLGVEPSGMGASICRIDGQGCSPPGESCFCRCVSSPCVYWSYWRMIDGEWQYSNIGASSATVQPGEVQAWVWGEGIMGREAELAPPRVAFEEICAPAAPEKAASAAGGAVETVPRPAAGPRLGALVTGAAILGGPLLLGLAWILLAHMRRRP